MLLIRCHIESGFMKRKKYVVETAIWSALAICLSIFEGFIPMPGIFYGAKIGLSNVAVMTAMATISPVSALLVCIIKAVASGILSGAVSAIPYSLAGGILALLSMSTAYRYANRKISFVGISVTGAVFHSIGQVLVSAFVLQSIKIFAYLPILIAVSSATGFFTGICANAAIFRMKSIKA